ncbi:MAG: hypothetical protein ACYC4Q_08285 [Victivallaceae bacterium]
MREICTSGSMRGSDGEGVTAARHSLLYYCWRWRPARIICSC